MDSFDPVRIFKIMILFYNQFKGIELKALVKDFIQVEMTTTCRLPKDLEYIMAEAVEMGLENEDAIEDAV
jgi:hypothetical protein